MNFGKAFINILGNNWLIFTKLISIVWLAYRLVCVRGVLCGEACWTGYILSQLILISWKLIRYYLIY